MNVHDLVSDLRFPAQGQLADFTGATGWLNSEPLTTKDLEGRVVAVDFWTYTCINWLRTLPALRAWAETYAEHGLTLVGVHTPEFGVEHDIDNVRRAVREMGIEYPVALDNDYAVWNAFRNQYWPALYVADTKGRIRHHHFGEGGEETAERAIRHLLTEAGHRDLPQQPAPVVRDFELPADWPNVRSPETYVGFARASGFASPGLAEPDRPHHYSIPTDLQLNQWALEGDWTVGDEQAVCNTPGDHIAYRFHARDLHLILAPPANGAPARFRIRLDGQPPGEAHGLDIDEHGNGIVEQARLHQLIRQRGPITDRHFEIEFLDPGVAALCFTFG